MLQIQFLDKNIADALVPAFSLKPKHLIFFYDRREINEHDIRNVRAAIEERLDNVVVGFMQTDKYSVQEIRNTLLSCIDDFKEERICIDITGGPDLMTATGLILSKEYDLQVVYMNLSKGYIFDVNTGDKIADVCHMSTDDYLTAIGAKHFKLSHSMPKEQEFESICKVVEYLFEHISEWHALHKYLSDKYAGSEGLDFDITTNVIYNGHSYNSEEILSIFVDNGFATKKSHGRYKFANKKYKEYMTVFGIWLEMYIYIKSQGIFEETHLGYIIDWNNSDAEDTVDNEIDVLVVKKSIPIFISCKMKKPDPMDVYEVAYLADRLGGPKAKGIIATTYDVSDDKKLAKGIYQRFKKMNVGFIETSAFKTHTPAQIFNTALQGAE